MGSIYVLRSHLTIGICRVRKDSSFVRRWIFIYCLYSSYFMLYSINCGVSSRDSLPCYQYWGLRSLIFSLIIVNTDGCLCLLLLKEKWRRHIFAFIYSGNFIRPSLVKISLIIENSNTYIKLSRGNICSIISFAGCTVSYHRLTRNSLLREAITNFNCIHIDEVFIRIFQILLLRPVMWLFLMQ